MRKKRLTVKKLERIMQEHGAVLRAVPNTTISIYETSLAHLCSRSNTRVEYLEGYNREMLVVESVPNNAGKFFIESVRSTSSTIQFSAVQFTNGPYDSIEDAVNALLEGKVKTPYHKVGKRSKNES